jgi:bifunctional non-homologous end joining protein LigD
VPYFYAFDLLWLNGHDLRKLPLIERKQRLKEVMMEANSPTLLYADYVEELGRDFFRMICDKDLEGIVAKPRASLYDKRAKWVKSKNPTYTQAVGRHELIRAERPSDQLGSVA